MKPRCTKRYHESGNVLLFGLLAVASGVIALNYFVPTEKAIEIVAETKKEIEEKVSEPILDKEAYDKKLIQMANYPKEIISTSTASTTASTVKKLWPVKSDYPKAGALLPFNRIVAYYGNFYSTRMGALGEYPEEEALERLMNEVERWEKADPTTPVIPAIDYIAITAQADAGTDGMYRLRMPDKEIDKAIEMAKKVNGIVILEMQIGLSTLEVELPLLEKYLKMPQVHLALDPEFAMHDGRKPGEYIGTLDAKEINYTSEYLARLVKEYDLPPKVLIVHRFTENMVTNYQNITLRPEIQIVMDMDGWGAKERKIGTYKQVIQPEPVQFTGFKLFYKNDFFEEGSRIMTPEEVLELQPRPVFIQYQ